MCLDCLNKWAGLSYTCFDCLMYATNIPLMCEMPSMRVSSRGCRSETAPPTSAGSACVSVCASMKERWRERESLCVCAKEKVRERGGERERVCEREREQVAAGARLPRPPLLASPVSVCASIRESEGDVERESVCACACEDQRERERYRERCRESESVQEREKRERERDCLAHLRCLRLCACVRV